MTVEAERIVPLVRRIPQFHAWVDVSVVVAVLVATNLVAHFTTVWASIATVPIAAGVLVAIMRQRGMHWNELGLSPRQWKRGTLYSVGAIGLVLAVVAIGIALPFTRQFFLSERYATVSGALVASMIIIRCKPSSPRNSRFAVSCMAPSNVCGEPEVSSRSGRCCSGCGTLRRRSG